MQNDSYSATWVSHSSISDFLRCPRLYFLRNVYKDPKTHRKINIINPHIALGLVVHDTIESIATLSAHERFATSLLDTFDQCWGKVSGRKGGFRDNDEEEEFKARGRAMIQRLINHPGPLLNKAIRLVSPDTLPPRFCISVTENILLCGKVDWLEYIPETNSVHIIDFKTGKLNDDSNSLQLRIYVLLVKNCQKRLVTKVGFWYLEYEDLPREIEIPDEKLAIDSVLEIAVRIKRARLTRQLSCMKKDCFACKPFEAILRGEAELVARSEYQDIYIV